MKYEDFISCIVNSEKEDWLYDDDLERYVYKKDISISIVSDKENKEKGFYSDWINRLNDKTAFRARFFLCYNNSIVEAFHTAAVDGYRALIPYPDTNKMTITYKQYRIAGLVNISYKRLDEYLNLIGISIEE
jgi:hypothetical protein